jgi:peptidoglycan hydrolase-like protein with peptidoglycan-binding domain
LPYPGRIIKRNDGDGDIVLALQRRLNEVGCGPIDEDRAFGDQTFGAVSVFQARFTDQDNQPLKIDGEVGPLTWARLFGTQTVTQTVTPAGELATRVLDIARTQLGVLEVPLGSNRGPEVDEYVRATGFPPSDGFAWCVCFIFFCYREAATALGRANPMIETAGVLDLWTKAGQQGVPRVTQVKARNNPALIKPGQIFIIDTPPAGGGGHAGLVEQVIGGKLVTIEGNTNDDGSREGIGVFRRKQRKITSINKGFVDFTTA